MKNELVIVLFSCALAIFHNAFTNFGIFMFSPICFGRNMTCGNQWHNQSLRVQIECLELVWGILRFMGTDEYKRIRWLLTAVASWCQLLWIFFRRLKVECCRLKPQVGFNLAYNLIDRVTYRHTAPVKTA